MFRIIRIREVQVAMLVLFLILSGKDTCLGCPSPVLSRTQNGGGIFSSHGRHEKKPQASKRQRLAKSRNGDKVDQLGTDTASDQNTETQNPTVTDSADRSGTETASTPGRQSN